ncbi:hypothetical protein CBM2598_U10310 [Cupriavidus taiwanensis]|uniref:Uncharacterized protein n=1 Tax=Cupriavidus taiwanensis TaxID=164546 RepID=A0A7Z7NPT1_9BURK|nr:hypothetical protein CBM2597_U10042 [Cupriavidus taiwanensis]SOZ96524.1 hypothetical protein CBM2598_U10310 [Cupriavidus taiwanensis]SPC25548.1 hypothetical protein CBM2594_U10049 [Cupriavidus taiwanensis]
MGRTRPKRVIRTSCSRDVQAAASHPETAADFARARKTLLVGYGLTWTGSRKYVQLCSALGSTRPRVDFCRDRL